MKKFKAASGREVTVGDDGSLMFGKALGYLSREATFDAEEFFQARRDAVLGRWRWPENPHLVVYPRRDGAVLVLNEMSVNGGILYRRGDSVADIESDAARAYFAVHPEPKPWHAAKPGEVWVLTVPDEGDVDAEIVTVATTYGTFTAGSTSEWTHNDPKIITARRVLTVAAA